MTTREKCASATLHNVEVNLNISKYLVVLKEFKLALDTSTMTTECFVQLNDSKELEVLK